MNIFTALSARRDSKLRETNLSAIFAYFLDPAQDHGLGITFLKSFLEIVGIAEEIQKKQVDLAKTGVSTEKRYETTPSKNSKQTHILMDIEIEFANSKGDIMHAIVVENKIKPGAANLKQLDRYYKIFKKDNPDTKITMVFLTPDSTATKLKQEYEKLGLEESPKQADKDNKAWRFWTGDQSIQSMIRRDLLEKETAGKISPINEYAKHTLKAFAMHLETLKLSKTGIESDDLGNVQKTASDTVEGKEYIIKQFANTTIKVYHKGVEVPAKNILCKIAHNRKVDLKNSNKNKKNTRQLGAHVIERLEE